MSIKSRLEMLESQVAPKQETYTIMTEEGPKRLIRSKNIAEDIRQAWREMEERKQLTKGGI